MAWWGWCILGVVLLGVELLAVDAQFYLVFAGLAAIVVGLLGLVGIELPVRANGCCSRCSRSRRCSRCAGRSTPSS